MKKETKKRLGVRVEKCTGPFRQGTSSFKTPPAFEVECWRLGMRVEECTLEEAVSYEQSTPVVADWG